jgi:tartrate dehydrogenase/decarboxylase/D-malate dehydrogenase
MRKCETAIIPGDCVGIEIIGEGVKVVKTAGEMSIVFNTEYTNLPWSFELYGNMTNDTRDGVKI